MTINPLPSAHDNPHQRIHSIDQIQNPYAEQPMPAIGDMIGANRIEARLGEGGMANVYKVWHQDLEVVRAVKVLKKALNKESKERFLTEAKIMADIIHPNVVEIYNLGYINQQIPYIEMEFVEGESVKNLIAQQKQLPVTVALSITYFICQALYFAHRKDYTLYGKVYHGLIHRDIKPENIVVSKAGVIKLMDFGIARPSEVSLHTVAGKIIGTLVYLSPEQLSGKTLDHRSDLFSLGSVFYEMISGIRAFPQKTLQDLVNYKTNGEYLPLSSHGVTVNPSVTSIVEKSLALNPDDRFKNATEMAQASFACLHELTDRAPADILMRFMADPASITTTNLSRGSIAKPKTKKTDNTYWWIGLCAAEALVIGILVILLLSNTSNRGFIP